MKKLKTKIMEFLKKGLTPQGVAAAVSMGLVLGVFPIYGPVSLLSIALAALFRLNVPLVLAGVYAMTFVKPLLILPFLRFGEWVFRAEPMRISLVELSRRFGVDPFGTLSEFGWSFLHATVGWLVAVPLLFVLLYPVLLLIARKWKSGLGQGELSGLNAQMTP